MTTDLISRKALKEATKSFTDCDGYNPVWQIIDNAPTVEVGYLTNCANCERVEKIRAKRHQGEWVEFAKFVASEVCDEYFENNADCFAEVACRKLVKLGLLKLDGDTYRQKGGAE